jgi:hypothetical protein
MAYVRPGNANDFIEQKLHEYLVQLGEVLDADAITLSGGIIFGVDDVVRGCVEEMKRANSGKTRLAVVLTTAGGYIEVAQRIADTFRKHYTHVEFIIPNYAYSAGTVLVMCGDVIWMDYYSRLGPIDPQIQNKAGRMVPALGYLRQYERLIEKSQKGEITPAEVELLISGFDQAELYQYEQAKQQSVTLLEEWLAKYKFKDWIETVDRKIPVTPEMKKQRASEIAHELNKTDKWHSHGHGISKDVLIRELNLMIDDYGENAGLNESIKKYYDLLDDYMMKQGHGGVLHINGYYVPLM